MQGVRVNKIEIENGAVMTKHSTKFLNYKWQEHKSAFTKEKKSIYCESN
jgi:hypothetical protein